MTQIIMIDKDEASQEDGLFCDFCGGQFHGNENAYLEDAQTPSGQMVACAHCHRD